MNALTFGLLIASIEGYSHGLKPSYIGISVILLVVIGTLFVRSQLHKPYPILPFDLLRIPIFSVSVITRSARSSPRCSLWSRFPSTCKRHSDIQKYIRA